MTGFLEKIKIAKYMNKRIIFSSLFFALATICLILAQNSSNALDDLSENKTHTILSFIGVKLSATEIKVSMNEYLLRYLSTDIKSNYENTNFTVIQAEPDNPSLISYYNPNLTDWFDSKDNVQFYFGDVGNLNSIRPLWYSKESDFMQILLNANSDFNEKIRDVKKQRDRYILFALLFNIAGIIILSSALSKVTRDNSVIEKKV